MVQMLLFNQNMLQKLKKIRHDMGSSPPPPIIIISKKRASQLQTSPYVTFSTYSQLNNFMHMHIQQNIITYNLRQICMYSDSRLSQRSQKKLSLVQSVNHLQILFCFVFLLNHLIIPRIYNLRVRWKTSGSQFCQVDT